jgi:hypothetical protein
MKMQRSWVRFSLRMMWVIGAVISPPSFSTTKWVPSYQQKIQSSQTPKADLTQNQIKEVDADLRVQEAENTERKQQKSFQHLVHKDLVLFYKDPLTREQLDGLKKTVLQLQGKAVSSLVTIMKDNTAPDRSRWVVTFLLGKLMGMKASPLLAKFLYHPNWVLRLASLKTLFSLKERRFIDGYLDKLKDSSFIVRIQALEVISKLNISQAAPQVWSMLFDESNYVGQKGKLKRSSIIKQAIRTLGDLRYDKVKSPLLSMILEKKYEDVFDDLDYGLTQITGKSSPNGDRSVKKVYWSRLYISEKEL